MEAEDFYQPEDVLIDMYLSVGGKILAWSADVLTASDFALRLDGASLELPESDDEQFVAAAPQYDSASVPK